MLVKIYKNNESIFDSILSVQFGFMCNGRRE